MRWRIIALETHDAYFNMAADHAISEAVSSGSSDPTVRFYKWHPSAVSIGCFQSMNDEVDVQKCREAGVDYVRRRTGGGAVFHDESGEITYSVIVPEGDMPKGIIESYRLICGWIVDSLAAIGIAASFAPINDLVVNGKKISGNAQTRRDGVLVQHGTVLYNTDLKRMFSLLKVDNAKLSDKAIKSVEERVTKVLDYAQISQDELYAALLSGFTKGKDFYMGEMSDEEVARANALSREIYGSEGWNFSR
ncbi:MAG TPA: biotin/lipoate A/B protein ligase family protein [Candidatus Acidoferrales bacterium]|nr:biotin/lipoate A/B protein ligase family protein [Candidatus Acidoferrales bacterium]